MWPPGWGGGGPGHDPSLLHGPLRQGYPVLDTAGHNIVPGQNFNVATDGTVSRIDPCSNTGLAVGMTELISLQRNFQMSSRALSLQDSTVGDATQLGRLR
jgi:flagellar basal body rod protein FlgG